MGRYDMLLLALLDRLDKKADRLISLLEVSQHAENSCDQKQIHPKTQENLGGMGQTSVCIKHIRRC